MFGEDLLLKVVFERLDLVGSGRLIAPFGVPKASVSHKSGTVWTCLGEKKLCYLIGLIDRLNPASKFPLSARQLYVLANFHSTVPSLGLAVEERLGQSLPRLPAVPSKYVQVYGLEGALIISRSQD